MENKNYGSWKQKVGANYLLQVFLEDCYGKSNALYLLLYTTQVMK